MMGKERLFSLLVLAGCAGVPGQYVDGICVWPLEVGCDEWGCPSLAETLPSWRDCEVGFSLVQCTEGGDWWTISWDIEGTEDAWMSHTRRYWGPDGQPVTVAHTYDVNSYECEGESSFTAVYGELLTCSAVCAYEGCDAGGTVALATGESACPAGTEPPGVEPP